MEFGSVADIVSALIAVAAFVGVVREYRQNSRIKRLELVQNLDYTMETDEEIKFAVTSLDWGAGVIPVPTRWREVVNKPGIRPDLRLLGLGVAPGFSKELEDEPVALMYRHCFVALFNHLERVKLLHDKKAIEIEDLNAVSWVASQLVDFPYARQEQRADFFLPAIKRWYLKTALDQFILRLHAHSSSFRTND